VQAAYNLIPLNKRESFHLLLGSRLYMASSPSEISELLFFIVDNMNRGLHFINDMESKYEVAQLNLEAGEKALSASAFHSAAKYLLKGLSLLGPDPWEAKYDLSIRLYDAGAFSGL
jgi:predicted ATPase